MLTLYLLHACQIPEETLSGLVCLASRKSQSLAYAGKHESHPQDSLIRIDRQVSEDYETRPDDVSSGTLLYLKRHVEGTHS